MVETLWTKYHEIIMLALVQKNGLGREFVTCVKLGLTWIINKSNKWFNIWSWKPAFQLELIQKLKHKHELKQQRIGSRQGIDSKCSTLHVSHKCGHKGYVVLASLFWYKMHTTCHPKQPVLLSYIWKAWAWNTWYLSLCIFYYWKLFLLRCSLCTKYKLGKYLLQISYTHFEPTSNHSLGSVSTLTNPGI